MASRRPNCKVTHPKMDYISERRTSILGFSGNLRLELFVESFLSFQVVELLQLLNTLMSDQILSAGSSV